MESPVFMAFLGIFSGIASAMFGIGGGTIIVPSMMLSGADITFAVGISIMQMVFTSIFGSYLNYRKRLISLKTGLALGVGGLLGSSLSGLILLMVSERILLFVFLGFTIASFLKFFFSRKTIYQAKAISRVKKAIVLILSGIIVGIFSSSLGIGGGLLLAPLLGVFLGLNSKEAIPLALFFICFSSFSGAISLYSVGLVDLSKGVWIGVFAMIGVYIGTITLQKISTQTHKTLLFFVYLFSIGTTLFKIF